MKNHFVGWKHQTNSSRYSSVRCKHPPLYRTFRHFSALFTPPPLLNCPSFQTAQTRLPSLHSLYLIAPAPARRLGARASAPIPPLSPPQHPSPAQTHQVPASGCSPSACDCPASYLPCTSAVPRHTSRKCFCLFKNPVLLTQLPPPLSVSRASISSDLYSINTSIGHSPADSPIHLARQLDLFPLTALVFVRLFGTDLFPSLAQPSSLLENHIKSRQLLAPAIRFQGKTQSPPLPSSNRCPVLLGRGSQPPARPRG